MSIKINILNTTEKFNDVLGFLTSTCENTLADINKHTQLPTLDIVISPCSEEDKTEIGIMGFVTTPYLINILLDTDREDLITIIKEQLPAALAHELHHVIRAASGVEEKTLFQQLISEGLACHFETKFDKNASAEFFDEVKQHEWRDLLSKMQTNLDNTDIDYPMFFGGKDVAMFPNRAGYWVGFNIVTQYIEKHGGCAATLVGVPAEKFM